MVGTHHTLHLPDQVTENLHSADTKEVLRRCIAVVECVDKLVSHLVDFTVRVNLIGCHTGKEVAADLRSALNDGLQIRLFAVIAADEISERHTHRYGTVPVAELTVIIHLESCIHGMIFDCKSIYNCLRRLNIVAQILVKTVLINAFA